MLCRVLDVGLHVVKDLGVVGSRLNATSSGDKAIKLVAMADVDGDVLPSIAMPVGLISTSSGQSNCCTQGAHLNVEHAIHSPSSSPWVQIMSLWLLLLLGLFLNSHLCSPNYQKMRVFILFVG